MSARYLLRLDDACPTMDARRWQQFEELFERTGTKPLVAVVPDNRDPDLECGKPDPMFWDKVRSWQANGWTIAMHGYQHLMHQTDAEMVLPFYRRSEFAGLGYEAQAEKIRRSWELFARQGIEPTVWIAPAHCFDRLTLEAIRNETPIRIVSDGIARDQYFDDGFYWLPQQLWKPTEKSSGLWTICMHPNTVTGEQFLALEETLWTGYGSRVTSVDRLTLHRRARTAVDRLYARFFWQRHRIHGMLHKLRSGSDLSSMNSRAEKRPKN